VNISIIPTAMMIMLKIQMQVQADDLEGKPPPPEKESGGSPIDTLKLKRPLDMWMFMSSSIGREPIPGVNA